MSVIKELKSFMMRGNVVDMAVGVVMGAAFGKIVTSLVNDVIMPPIGLIVGGVNFNKLSLVLHEATAERAAVTLNYGSFLQTVFDFTIISTAIFFAIRAMNSLHVKDDVAAPVAEAPAPSKEEVLLGEIRDLLKEKNSK